jgi:hypothetical protein
MSATPETDAAIKAQSEWKLPFVSYTMGGVTYDGPVATLCRKLERERDEARELADRYRVALCSANGDKTPTPFPWEEIK